MFETEPPRERELNLHEQKKFLEALAVMPASGIALRGDQLQRAEVLQQGLNDPHINYIVFTPPVLRPKVWGHEAQNLYRQLRSALKTALKYTDPWQGINSWATIADADFTSYTDYYDKNPTQLPAITWFTEAKNEQFSEVIKFGRIWADYELLHPTGNTTTFGIIPAEKIQPTLVLTIEDIGRAQESVIKNSASNKSSSNEEKKYPTLVGRLIDLAKGRLKTNQIALLRGKREELRKELSEIATLKLCDEIVKNFKES